MVSVNAQFGLHALGAHTRTALRPSRSGFVAVLAGSGRRAKARGRATDAVRTDGSALR